MDNIFAIGDIHGCKSLLERLIRKIDIDAERDILVLVGDYVDRGPDPKGVIDSSSILREISRM